MKAVQMPEQELEINGLEGSTRGRHFTELLLLSFIHAYETDEEARLSPEGLAASRAHRLSVAMAAVFGVKAGPGRPEVYDEPLLYEITGDILKKRWRQKRPLSKDGQLTTAEIKDSVMECMKKRYPHDHLDKSRAKEIERLTKKMKREQAVRITQYHSDDITETVFDSILTRIKSSMNSCGVRMKVVSWKDL